MKTLRSLIIALLLLTLVCSCLFGCSEGGKTSDGGSKRTERTENAQTGGAGTGTDTPAETDEEPIEEVAGSKGLYIIDYQSEGYCIVAGLGSCTDTEIVIPNRNNGLPVTEISNALFLDNKNITSVTIPEGIEKINGQAFCGTLITSIELPSTLKEIGFYAFEGCTELKSITIPNKVKTIGESCFAGCTSLVSFESGKSVETIGGRAFADCTALERVTLNEGLLHLGSDCFRGCSSLKEVVIPDGTLSIGSQAFVDCDSLETLVIPASLENLGGNFLSGVYSLKTLHYKGTSKQWYDLCSASRNYSISAENFIYGEDPEN